MQEGLFVRYQLKKLTKYRDIFLFSDVKVKNKLENNGMKQQK